MVSSDNKQYIFKVKSLKDNQRFDYDFSLSAEELDYDDVEKINSLHVKGLFKPFSNQVRLDLEIDGELVLVDARDFVSFNYHLNINSDIILSGDENVMYDYPITDVINLKDIVIGEIIINLPTPPLREVEE